MNELMMKTPSIDIREASFAFAIEVVRVAGLLPKTAIGLELSRQFLRAGISIGANVEEAQGARTKREFTNLMNIAKREAREVRYWLRVITASRLLQPEVTAVTLQDAERLVRVLTAIVKTSEGRC